MGHCRSGVVHFIDVNVDAIESRPCQRRVDIHSYSRPPLRMDICVSIFAINSVMMLYQYTKASLGSPPRRLNHYVIHILEVNITTL